MNQEKGGEQGQPAGRAHPAKRLLRHLLSFPAVLAAGLVVVTVLTVSKRFDDPDLWWHLRMGQIIATTHTIPSTDLFSFTAQGHSWTAHEWLAQLSIYWAYVAGGYRGLMMWLCVLASLIFVLVFVLCWLQTRNALVSFLGGLIAWFFGTIGLAIRPLIIGHLFLVLELLILELGRNRDRRWLWCLPPLFGVWANSHGTYFFGMGVLVVYWACSHLNGKWGLIVSTAWDRADRRTIGLVLVLSLAALCCNPVGIRLLLYPLNTLFKQSTGMNAVEEWLPPDLRGGRTIGMLVAIIGIFLMKLVRRSELRLRELLLVLAAFGLALQHERMMFLFGIIASPVLCGLLASELGTEAKRDHPIANAALLLAGVAAVLWGFPSDSAIRAQIRKNSPVAAVEYIQRAGLSGPMLNEYVFGGYLIWSLPQEKVFIDGRADVFDWTGVFQEYGRWVLLDEDPTLLLQKHHIRFCLLTAGTPIARVMAYIPGWRKAYSDDVAVVFVRSGEPS